METSASDAYQSYKAYVLNNGGKPLAASALKDKLKSRGFSQKRKKQGNFYTGFGLPAERQDFQPAPEVRSDEEEF